jgi:hypothetical protein
MSTPATPADPDAWLDPLEVSKRSGVGFGRIKTMLQHNHIPIRLVGGDVKIRLADVLDCVRRQQERKGRR